MDAPHQPDARETIAPAPRRRRLRLGLRALMTIVLIVGGGLGWFAYRVRVKRQAIAVVEAAGGRVLYDDEYRDGRPIPPNQRPKPSWLRRKLGDELFREVATVAVSAPRSGVGRRVAG